MRSAMIEFAACAMLPNGPGVHERRLPLERLHDVRLDRVLHDHGHRAGHLQHLRRHRLAVDGRRHDDAPETRRRS